MTDNFYSISRIEGNFAVVEFPDRSFQNIPLSILPKDVSEGNILSKDENGLFVIEKNEEIKRKQRISELQNKIFK